MVKGKATRDASSWDLTPSRMSEVAQQRMHHSVETRQTSRQTEDAKKVKCTGSDTVYTEGWGLEGPEEAEVTSETRPRGQVRKASPTPRRTLGFIRGAQEASEVGKTGIATKESPMRTILWLRSEENQFEVGSKDHIRMRLKGKSLVAWAWSRPLPEWKWPR